MDKNNMTHITEMVSDNMPDWAREAILEGRFFNIALDRVKSLEEYVRHNQDCSFYNCQQYSDGLDGQPVDCDCELINLLRG